MNNVAAGQDVDPITVYRERAPRYSTGLLKFKKFLRENDMTTEKALEHLLRLDENSETTEDIASSVLFSFVRKRHDIHSEMRSVLFPALANVQWIQDRLFCETVTGNSQSTLALIRRFLAHKNVRKAALPSKQVIADCANAAKTSFPKFLHPRILPSGFCVNLVRFVRFVLLVIHKVDSIEGVHVDIWGDALAKGKHREVTRLAFRLLSFPGAQSSQNVYTFASFMGKDNRINMEFNLGSQEHIGDPGWLYQQTQELQQGGAILSCSGDAPFILRLITAKATDHKGNLSHIPLYVSDPSQEKIDDFVKRKKIAKKLPLDCDLKQKSRGKFYEEALEEAGAILPSSVDRESGSQ